MNWFIWVVWVLKIALGLIGKIDRFKKEVPEALDRINAAKKEILDSLEDGLTAGEVEAIRHRVQQAWEEIDDVLSLIGKVIMPPPASRK